MSHKPTARTDHERPETYPVYQAVRKVRLDDSRESVLVGIKRTGMDTHFPDEQILHHDLAGRLLRISRPNVQWRRGLSGRMIELRRRTREHGGGLDRRVLNDSEINRWVDEAAARMRLVAGACVGTNRRQYRLLARHLCPLQRCLSCWMRQPASMPVRHATMWRNSRRSTTTFRFSRPISIRRSYWRPSDGCRYNRCTFCGFYRDTSYRAKTLDEFQAHVQAALAYHGRSLALRRGIFLGQANALMGPRPWRKEILRIVHRPAKCHLLT